MTQHIKMDQFGQKCKFTFYYFLHYIQLVFQFNFSATIATFEIRHCSLEINFIDDIITEWWETVLEKKALKKFGNLDKVKYWHATVIEKSHFYMKIMLLHQISEAS